VSPVPAEPFPARRLLLAGSGSIACADLPMWVTWIRQSLGIEVRILLTRRARSLVSEAALAAISGHPVAHDSEAVAALASVPHQELASWGEAVLVAPATANLVAKVAHGIADDLLTTVLLATERPVVLAPALTPAMAAKPATRRNLETLADDGYGVVPTARGFVASDGSVGEGAVADPPTALAFLKRFMDKRALEAA